MAKEESMSASVTSDSPEGLIATETLRREYNKAKLNPESARILNRRIGFADHIAAGIRRFSTMAPDYGFAQDVLGEDFITPQEVTKVRPFERYNHERMVKFLARTLPSDDVLQWYKNNDYIVMPASSVRMSLCNVREILSGHFYTQTGGWYANERFAHKEVTALGWIAIKKAPLQNSVNKVWSEQNSLLSAVERVPNMAELALFAITYFEVRGIRLFEEVGVRSSSIENTGEPVYLESFTTKGVRIHSYKDVPEPALGLAAAKR